LRIEQTMKPVSQPHNFPFGSRKTPRMDLRRVLTVETEASPPVSPRRYGRPKAATAALIHTANWRPPSYSGRQIATKAAALWLIVSKQQERSSWFGVRSLDYSYASQRALGASRNRGAYGGIVCHRGGSGPSIAPTIRASPAQPESAFRESVGQDTDFCLRVFMRGRRWLHRRTPCAPATD
jgi:hypothetical protein